MHQQVLKQFCQFLHKYVINIQGQMIFLILRSGHKMYEIILYIFPFVHVRLHQILYLTFYTNKGLRRHINNIWTTSKNKCVLILLLQYGQLERTWHH